MPDSIFIQSQPDPRCAGRTAFVISGPTPASVQSAIDRLVASVDAAIGGAPGLAQFIGPRPVETDHGPAWGALGHVIVFQKEHA